MKLKINNVSKWVLMLAAFAFCNMALAQKVSGVLTDAESGDPLIGANILVVGTATGTVTDFDGAYELNLPDGAKQLEFSYTGYATQVIDINGQTTISVEMSSGELLDEVVVIGYGTVKKSDLTGAVSSLKADDFNQGIQVAPDQLIQGKIPGVQVINNSGAPGGATTVRIRGSASIRAGNEPLYVIDGIPLDGRAGLPDGSGFGGNAEGVNPLSFINPADIESVQVLKDASATAIYGSRGANGVIIVTTRKGRSGDPTMKVAVGLATSSVAKEYEVLSADEYRSALSQYGLTGGDFGSSVDAFDEITRNSFSQNYNVSVGGGSDKGKYRISLGYQDVEGVIESSSLERFTANIRGNYDLLNNERLNLDFNLLVARNQYDFAPVGTDVGFQGNIVSQALIWNPTQPLYNSDGSFNIFEGDIVNPAAYNAALLDEADVLNAVASIAPSYKLTDNLTYKFQYSVNYGVGERREQARSFININPFLGQGAAGISSRTLIGQQFTHTLTWDQDLTANTSLNFLAGYEYLKYDNQQSFFGGNGFPVEDLDYTNIIQATDQGTRSMGSLVDPTTELQSFFGRANFNISDKYLITATVRADGSSKFGENNRYGVFPSLGLAWNMMKEDFMSGSSLFNDLKLRGSWGITGNQEFDAGAAQTRWRIVNNGGLIQENVANPDLKWENSTMFNVGFDFAILDYKLSGSIDYFNKTTEDLLFNFQVTAPGPASRYWTNLPGEVVNSGLELGLTTFLVNNDNITWDLGINAAFLQNELSGYVGPPVLTGNLFGQGTTGVNIQRLENGQPLNAYYLATYEGLSSEGTSVFAKDGAREFVGDPNPDILLGISTMLTAGKLTVGLNFNGAMGHQIYNNTAMSVLPISNLGSRNVDANLIGGGTQESTANAIQASTRYLEDGDYIKLANATIGYKIGDLGGGVRDVTIGLTGQNLIFFTGYTGFDPEVNTVNVRDGVPSFGIEYIPYPSARTILLNLSASF